MIEYPLAALGGLLGSAHCIGMCGPIVVSLSIRGRPDRSALRRQLIYASGRVATYVLLGMVCGFAGLWLGGTVAAFSHYRPYVTAIGGLVLLAVGLNSSGMLAWPWRRKSEACMVPTLFARLHGSTSQVSAFFGGALNGLLPCGLVYGFLSLAFASSDLFAGGLLMACFGVGTIPALATLGAGATQLPCHVRHFLLRCAGWAMIVTASWLIARAVIAIVNSAPSNDGLCPLC